MPEARLDLVWDDRFLDYDFGPTHPFSERSRWLAVELVRELGRAGTLDPDTIRWASEVAPAPREALGRFHRAGYLDRVDRLDRAGRGELLDQGDTPSFPGCFTAAARLVSGTLLALEQVRAAPHRAFNAAGGLHHAGPDRASGFCIFNDLAVAIATALDSRQATRVAYIDIDAHHGDGVMYGFYGDGRVLDIDFHQDGRTLFPGTGFPAETGTGDGAGLKVNLPLVPGTGDAGLLALFERVVPPLLLDFHPELIVLQCGVDGHAGDRLGATALEYTPAAYQGVVRGLDRLARELGDRPMIVTGGGGYSPENVARVLAAVALWLVQAPVPDSAPLPDPWRARFEEESGWPAPANWEAEASPRPWTSRAEENLVGELERALGRRFPKPSNQSPP